MDMACHFELDTYNGTPFAGCNTFENRWVSL